MLIFCVAVFLLFTYSKEKKEIAENIPQYLSIPSLETKKELKSESIKSAVNKKTEQKKEKVKSFENITLIMGEATVNFSVAPNTLFYDALVKEKSFGRIEFSGKNYPGLGFFVTGIGPLHASGGKDLFYYINGKEATVGISSYTLKNDDVIEWKIK